MAKPSTRAPYSTKHQWTSTEARAALAAARSSGLSLGAFAKRKGLVAQRLYWWQQRLAARKPSPARSSRTPTFVELKAPVPERVEVRLRSGRVLCVAESIDSESLRRLVAALEQSEPC